ncbi:site-specific recombinase [Micromonospora inaquosa]|uniref:Site-specific recombinase n=1 Tax=Micromonospora inaquosa TaxID=2203716 RepID=A0A3N9WCY0_9ACTN|nr:site-specific recombinase [Micromonospora inaquosa]
MREVRPRFRAEVFRPDRDDSVFVTGECRVVNCPNMVGQPTRGICDSHYQRWLSTRSEAVDFDAWLAGEDERLARRGVPPACDVVGCNRSTLYRGLCPRHAPRWAAAGRPDRERWLAGVRYTPTSDGERDCTFTGCPRWTNGPGNPFCQHHHSRWTVAGRPDPVQWQADLRAKAGMRQVPHVNLARLDRGLRLEVQYGLQCRHDEANKRTTARAVTLAVKRLADAGVTSILDLDEDGWRTFFGTNRRIYEGKRLYASVSLKFVLDTRIRLQRLLIGDDPWADQYPREVWDLRLLGVAAAGLRFLRFGGIAQPWLGELARRWCRWRLAQGLTVSTVHSNLLGLTSFAARFAAHAGPAAGPEQLTRQEIESWLAGGRPAGHIGGVGRFLRDVQRHGWAPGIPGNALIFDDFPRKPASKPRWISEHLMRQLESETNLALFGNDDARLILRILIHCGLRLKDARHLPFDCVVRDNSDAPYLAWINHKIHQRAAFFPIAEDLATRIADQQTMVLARFPDGCRWLFPALKVNLDGARPMPDISFRDYLDTWLRRIRLVDEHRRPARVTAHQFRHTLGTRLINADVPQHIVQQLLDHMSPQMTAVYARLHNSTVRAHWEKAVKVNADGHTAAIPADHPLASAAWTRLSLVRAKVTLPNGYCGAPVQTDCEYANPCLDCRFFITTADFLDQHRRQRDDTDKLIDDAQAAGLSRIAERNRRTLGRLDAIITALETTGPGQVLAGGTVETLDAAS